MANLFSVLSWVVPPFLVVALSGVVALVRMGGELGRHADELGRAREDVKDLRRRLDVHDAHLTELSAELAGIAEGVAWIKTTLGRLVG